MRLPSSAACLLVFFTAVPTSQQELPELTPCKPLPFTLSAIHWDSLTVRVVVPPSATAMHVWTTGATNDISLAVSPADEVLRGSSVPGADIWLDEEVLLSVFSTTPLTAGEWIVNLELGIASLDDDLFPSASGVLHVAFPPTAEATLVPGEVLELELTRASGLLARLELPKDFAPERRSHWRLEAYSPRGDIDLLIGPAKLPASLDYPYAKSQRAINYEVVEFEGRRASNLAVLVFGYLDFEVADRLPIRIRLTELRPGAAPPPLVPALVWPPSVDKSLSPQERVVQSMLALFGPLGGGSGTLISSTGLVLTNAHVTLSRTADAALAERGRLRRSGFHPRYFAGFQRDLHKPVVPEFGLELIASSQALDLALLRIRTTLDGRPLTLPRLPAMPLGDSTSIALGDPLFALGFPMTGGTASLVTITLTRGICAGFTSEEAGGLIKTDAGVHAGISGGALLDADWSMVGIPSSSITDSNYAGGIGYAVPTQSIPAAWLELAGREDLERVLEALDGRLPGNTELLPGTTPLEWALLRADAAAIVDPDLAPTTRQHHAERLFAHNLQSVGPLLAELSCLDLTTQAGRQSAEALRQSLGPLLPPGQVLWNTTPQMPTAELPQALAHDRRELEHILNEWSATCRQFAHLSAQERETTQGIPSDSPHKSE